MTNEDRNVRLKTKIFDSGMSQREIGKEARIGESRLSSIVNGWIDATGGEKKRLAGVLECPVSEIF